jgi:hypothetical protein
VRRAGATGELTMRADSEFWSAKTVRACRRHQLRYSISVRQTTPIRAAIATINEHGDLDVGADLAGAPRRFDAGVAAADDQQVHANQPPPAVGRPACWPTARLPRATRPGRPLWVPGPR